MNGGFDLDTDTWKMALCSSSTSNITSATLEAYANLTGECLSASTGYAGGGASVTLVLTGSTQIMVDVSTDPVYTATTDGIKAHYAVLYEVGGNILVWCPVESNSSSVTVTSGNTLTIAAASTGVFTLS